MRVNDIHVLNAKVTEFTEACVRYRETLAKIEDLSLDLGLARRADDSEAIAAMQASKTEAERVWWQASRRRSTVAHELIAALGIDASILKSAL